MGFAERALPEVILQQTYSSRFLQFLSVASADMWPTRSGCPSEGVYPFSRVSLGSADVVASPAGRGRFMDNIYIEAALALNQIQKGVPETPPTATREPASVDGRRSTTTGAPSIENRYPSGLQFACERGAGELPLKISL